MKIDLKDVTFLILVRLDSIERVENVILVTNQLCKYFHTNVFVLEVSDHNNGILKALLNRKIKYFFIEDKDPVLYKTKYYNLLASKTTTTFLAIWDTDIIIDKNAVIEAVSHLRNKYDVAFPYNGVCYNVSDIVKRLFMSKKDIRILYRHRNKMELLYDHPLVGGAVFFDKEKYIYAGKENENHYGWGNDDFDRYYRFVEFGFKIHRVNTCLFHLIHPKVLNSGFRTYRHEKKSARERFLVENSSKVELLSDISSNSYDR